jgi:hypothetical protein
MRRFLIVAAWDSEAEVWWGTNDELPLTTEAPTLTDLGIRANEIGQEIAEINGLVEPGEPVEIDVIEGPAQRAG